MEEHQTPSSYHDWALMYQQEPWGDRWADWRSAVLATQMAGALSGEKLTPAEMVIRTPAQTLKQKEQRSSRNAIVRRWTQWEAAQQARKDQTAPPPKDTQETTPPGEIDVAATQ